MGYEAKPRSIVASRADVISLRTKYSTAERKYPVPSECFRDLVVDLRRLILATSGLPTKNANSKSRYFGSNYRQLLDDMFWTKIRLPFP
jgi:hypothetical protein